MASLEARIVLFLGVIDESTATLFPTVAYLHFTLALTLSPTMEYLRDAKPSHVAAGLLVMYGLYHLGRAVYLLYLSPLAIYPGSPWAALSE